MGKKSVVEYPGRRYLIAIYLQPFPILTGTVSVTHLQCKNMSVSGFMGLDLNIVVFVDEVFTVQ